MPERIGGDTQSVYLFREHAQLEHQAEEQNHCDGEVTKQAKPIVAVVPKRLGDRCEEEDYNCEHEADNELLLGARMDVHAETDEEHLRAKAGKPIKERCGLKVWVEPTCQLSAVKL